MSAQTARVTVPLRRVRLTWWRPANVAFAIAIVVLAGLWAVTFRPQSLGGPAGYVLVRGVSMEPMYHTGDLVLVRAESSYRVGDVVAYRVPDDDIGAGMILIHRIIGGSASEGFVLQGDNNTTPDEWHPRGGDVVGKAWIVLPRAGGALAWLRDPLVLASLAAGLGAAMVLGPRKKPSDPSKKSSDDSHVPHADNRPQDDASVGVWVLPKEKGDRAPTPLWAPDPTSGTRTCDDADI